MSLRGGECRRSNLRLIGEMPVDKHLSSYRRLLRSARNDISCFIIRTLCLLHLRETESPRKGRRPPARPLIGSKCRAPSAIRMSGFTGDAEKELHMFAKKPCPTLVSAGGAATATFLSSVTVARALFPSVYQAGNLR